MNNPTKHSRGHWLGHGLRVTAFSMILFGLDASIQSVNIDTTLLSQWQITYSLGSVAAQRSRDSKKKDDKRRVPNVKLTTANKIIEAEELISESNDPQAAVDVLTPMLARGTRRYNGNEIAQIHRLLAYAYYEMDQVDKTIFHNEEILKNREDIREGQEIGTMWALTQLYFSVERYQEALDMANEWLAMSDDPGPNPYQFIANIYFAMQDFDNSIIYMERAIAMATERGFLPIKKNWWELLKYMYFEKENYPKVVEILEILVRDYPDRKMWISLAGAYSENGEDAKALYALECAHILGLFERQSDYMQYAGLLMNAEVFIRSGWYLQEGFDSGIVEDTYRSHDQLGQAYQASFEFDSAIVEFEKAAVHAENGKIHRRLAQLYLGSDKFDECIDAADKSLDLGGIDRTYNVKVLRGMCEFWQHSLNAAKKTFTQVRTEARREEDQSAEKNANNWIKYISNEETRLAEIARHGG